MDYMRNLLQPQLDLHFHMKLQELKQNLQTDVILIIVLVMSLHFTDLNYYKSGYKKKKHYVQDYKIFQN